MRKVEIRLRHWIYVDDTKFFGPGRFELLELILQTGSIARAAKDMGLSYKKAWAMVDSMNTLGQKPYVITQKGGSNGGGTVVTETGKSVLEGYHKLNEKLLAVIQAEEELQKLI